MASVDIKVNAIVNDAVKGLNSVGDAVDGVEEKTKKLSKSQQALSSAMSGIYAAAGPALVAAFGAAAVASVNLAVSAEQTEMAFTNLLGSGQKANKFLGELRDFAAKTPFEFNDLTAAARKMMAFGFAAEEVIPMLTNIGDAVAAMGGNADMVDRVTLALGQMAAKGKVSGGEMMQLTEAGIPAWKYLAASIGVSTAEVMKLSEKGLIPADKAIKAINEGLRQDFGGMMAQQSATAAGGLSNLQDALAATGTKFGELFLPVLKSSIPVLTDFVGFIGGGATAMEDMMKVGALLIDQFNVMNGTITQADAAANAYKLANDGITLAEVEAAKAQAAHNAETERWVGLAGQYIEAQNLATAAQDVSISSVDKLSIGMQKYTDLLLFNKAAAELDADAALALGVAMGVVDTQSVLAAQSVEVLKAKYDSNHDGAISASEAAAGYSAAVIELQKNIAALPDQKDIRINVIQNGLMPSIPSPGSGQTAVGFSHGADFIVPPGYPNDTFPMRVESGERVIVIPREQMQAGTTNNYTLNMQNFGGAPSVPDLFAQQARANAGAW